MSEVRQNSKKNRQTTNFYENNNFNSYVRKYSIETYGVFKEYKTICGPHLRDEWRWVGSVNV